MRTNGGDVWGMFVRQRDLDGRDFWKGFEASLGSPLNSWDKGKAQQLRHHKSPARCSAVDLSLSLSLAFLYRSQQTSRCELRLHRAQSFGGIECE